MSMSILVRWRRERISRWLRPGEFSALYEYGAASSPPRNLSATTVGPYVNVAMARLGQQQSAEGTDTRCGRVHPTLPPACTAIRIRQNPALRFYGESVPEEVSAHRTGAAGQWGATGD